MIDEKYLSFINYQLSFKKRLSFKKDITIMITYEFLQQYWWFLIALLGGLLVFLLFVQGGNAG